ncbi:protein FAR1-RELATED SEQUENCE 8 [Solanum lycopersicum]|uniref:protein FAR1-RELATED SEQUENCE 8 n=1 Tax=Solanum lycopersicum TaxID=4081 RepID=UPI0002766182|nr:protein FAR1-RELATED SEQUENCE 8 [Solanum lycopersicum]XP_010322662.1 protein FAR1-RELATED SEQUENCE 8 [Solanum lycopersicum]
MEEGMGTSEQLPVGEGSDNEAASEEVFDITCNGTESDGDQVLNIEANELGTTAGQILEFESHEAEKNCEHVLNFESGVPRDNSHRLSEFHSNGLEDPRCGDTAINDCHTGSSLGKSYPPPVVGMEFESYEDAYNYYNCYAKELGFAIRVKSSWTKRNSKEKRGAVLCCNCEGFKTMKEANSRRKETRTGCLAMVRLRLVESNRWRVDEVKLEHNHLFDPERVQNSKSHKKMDAGVKRKLEPAVDVEVRTIKLYRTPAVETSGEGSSDERAASSQIDGSTRLKLKEGDTQVIYNFFCRMQLTKPNFFYIMDFDDEGYLKNVFWIDSRSRAAYAYFGDVVVVDTTCLSKKYDIPLLAFFGLNHHKETLLLGCSLLADESFETYVWLLRAWLSCMSGRPPQTIITDRCKALQNAISEIFPRANHRLNLSIILDSIVNSVGEVGESEVFHEVLYNTVYGSLKIDEFEVAWEEMAQRFGCGGYGWFQSLYDDRERWAPIYMKDTFLAGISIDQNGEFMCPFFDGFVHKETNLREFFDIYDFVLQKNHQKEVVCDLDSKEFSPVLRTRCNYELQLSKLYTKEIFLKFQEEMDLMSNCSGIAQIHTNGPIITYMVKERGVQGDMSDARDVEVTYDKIGVEVRCMCSCFNFRGYLCRHALSVLNYNGIEEIPNHYILTRWRKDFKRLYAPELGSSNIDISNPVQLFDHLHRRAMQVVDEGMVSQHHYMVAWQAFKESLNKVRLAADKRVS